MSRTFSMNCGSVESLKVSTRCGLSAKARQIRLMADCDMPRWRARLRVDQWVASVGVVSRVVTSTCSTCSSVIVRAAPGRGSSARPSSRWATNRERHLVTVGRDTRSWAATAALLAPSAQASTIRQRSANAWPEVRRLAHRSSVVRSSSVSASLGSLGPRRRGGVEVAVSMPGPYQTSNQPATQDTRGRWHGHDRTA
jgi:hypothetical protein